MQAIKAEGEGSNNYLHIMCVISLSVASFAFLMSMIISHMYIMTNLSAPFQKLYSYIFFLVLLHWFMPEVRG